MKIRTATMADLDALAAVEARCFPAAEAASREELAARLRAYGDHFWLLEEDGRITAFADGMVTDQPDLTDELYARAELHREDGAWQMIFGVNTLPEYRRQGRAAALLRRAMEDARSQGRAGLVLTCKEALILYYAGLGFVNEGISASVHGNVTWYQMRLRFPAKPAGAGFAGTEAAGRKCAGAGIVHLRTAQEEDAAAIAAIYAPYVRETAITFEYEPPDEAEFRRRIRATLTRYPYLAAERDGELLGYAYTGAFRSRAAYGWMVEPSIYLRWDLRGNGLGRRFYRALEDISRAQGVQTVCACVACAPKPSPYVTDASIRFHQRMGYALAGQLPGCGFKFGEWFGTCYFEKALGDYPAEPAPLIPFRELPPQLLRAAGVEA